MTNTLEAIGHSELVSSVLKGMGFRADVMKDKRNQVYILVYLSSRQVSVEEVQAAIWQEELPIDASTIKRHPRYSNEVIINISDNC